MLRNLTNQVAALPTTRHIHDAPAGTPKPEIESAFQPKAASPKPQAALQSLVKDLEAAQVAFTGACRTTADREALTVYVANPADQQAIEQALRKVAQGQPGANPKKLQYFLSDKAFTVAVRVAPSLEDAQRALVKDMKRMASAMGKGVTVATAIEEGRLVVSINNSVLLHDRERLGLESSMLANPATESTGLSWMGHPVVLRASDQANAPFSPQQRLDVLARLAQPDSPQKISTVRFQEGAAPGKLMEVRGGQGNVLVRDLAQPESAWVTKSHDEFFAQAAELRFGVDAPSRPVTSRINIDDLAPALRQRMADAWVKWIKDTDMVRTHEEWHSQHGSGGTTGPGSGELFMQFHSNMMEDFKSHLKTTGNADVLEACGGRLPEWDTTRPLPPEFTFDGIAPSRSINWPVPKWLTVKGEGQKFNFEGRSISSLNDLKTVDELGRCLGMSGAHAVGHTRLGGQMGGFASVGVSPFLLWHGKMEVFREDWLTTDSGKQFLASNPEGWTNPTANHHDHEHHHTAMRMASAPPRFTNEQVNREWIQLASLQPTGAADFGVA